MGKRAVGTGLVSTATTNFTPVPERQVPSGGQATAEAWPSTLGISVETQAQSGAWLVQIVTCGPSIGIVERADPQEDQVRALSASLSAASRRSGRSRAASRCRCPPRCHGTDLAGPADLSREAMFAVAVPRREYWHIRHQQVRAAIGSASIVKRTGAAEASRLVAHATVSSRPSNRRRPSLLPCAFSITRSGAASCRGHCPHRWDARDRVGRTVDRLGIAEGDPRLALEPLSVSGSAV